MMEKGMTMLWGKGSACAAQRRLQCRLREVPPNYQASKRKTIPHIFIGRRSAQRMHAIMPCLFCFTCQHLTEEQENEHQRHPVENNTE